MLAANGLKDEHPRVRNQALMALGLILNVTSPMVQMKYHAELMPLFLKMISEETLSPVAAKPTPSPSPSVTAEADEKKKYFKS